MHSADAQGLLIRWQLLGKPLPLPAAPAQAAPLTSNAFSLNYIRDVPQLTCIAGAS